MSAALDLYADLRRRGVELEARGDRLRWRAPQGVVTEELLGRMREAKAELLGLLAPTHAWLERRTWEWRTHLEAHDPDHADLATCRELALQDWSLAIRQAPEALQ